MALRTEDPQPQPTKEARKRRGAIRGVAFIALALVAAAGVALLLTRYMEARVRAARVPTTKIVVAKADIPVADPIKPEWLDAIDWPAASRPEGAVADPKLLVGQVATVPIARGEAVLPSKLVVAGARSGLATIVPDGMRAVAVKVDDVVGVAGFIRPGDHVDVIVTMRPRDEAPFVSKIVLQNVRVLAVGKDIELKGKEAKEAKVVTVATLMVTSDESERLALSTDKGHILLSLRGMGDEEYADTRGITPPALLQPSSAPAPEPVRPESRVAAAKRPRPQRAAPPRPEVPAAAARDRQVVEILRGDLFEKRAFGAEEKQP